MVEEEKLKIEKFNGKNYQYWKMQIEDYLYLKELYLPLGGMAKKPVTMTDDARLVLDQKAFWLCLASTVAFNVRATPRSRLLLPMTSWIFPSPLV